jgi:hypothetical protein
MWTLTRQVPEHRSRDDAVRLTSKGAGRRTLCLSGGHGRVHEDEREVLMQ